MNTFKFIGTIPKPSDKSQMIKTMSNGNKQFKILIRQNETNSAFVQMYSDTLFNGSIPVFFTSNNGRQLVNFEDRLDKDILNKISFASKYIINNGDTELEFIWKDDFIEYAYEMITTMPSNTIYEIRGEYVITYYNDKPYNNFNIKSIKIANNSRPEFTMYLELFYNHNSFDERDKRNKFVLNTFIEQYVHSSKQREYFPLQVQFITNRFDFTKPTDIEIIKHRKSNMFPKEEEGYVKALWEAQYIRGAQLILPPLETLPKDIQFEIINAGRDIKDYMGKIVGEAKEYICLTRPDNTLNKEGKVYISLNCTKNEFESKINQHYKEQYENTLDNIAQEDAKNNPFN